MGLSIEEALKSVMEDSETSDLSEKKEGSDADIQFSEPVSKTSKKKNRKTKKKNGDVSEHEEKTVCIRPILKFSCRTKRLFKLYCLVNGLSERDAIIKFIEDGLEKAFDGFDNLDSFLELSFGKKS